MANKGIFWFAADDSSYEPLDFLPSGEYFAILKTDDGKIWVSSSNGILSIDYTNKKYETVFSSEGLSGDFFVRKASCVSANSTLIFGCKHGFVCVNPRFISKDATEHLSFSELYINGEKASFPKDSAAIVLDYGQTHLLMKLDMVNYAEKLTAIFTENDVRSVTVVRMQVPCCGGLPFAVKTAIENSGKDIPMSVVVIDPKGNIVQ